MGRHALPLFLYYAPLFPHTEMGLHLFEPLYKLLEPLADGSPAPVRLLRGSRLLWRAEQLRRCKSDEERAMSVRGLCHSGVAQVCLIYN